MATTLRTRFMGTCGDCQRERLLSPTGICLPCTNKRRTTCRICGGKSPVGGARICDLCKAAMHASHGEPCIYYTDSDKGQRLAMFEARASAGVPLFA